MGKKTRKWANLKGVLPEAPVEESERAIAIRRAVDDRVNATMIELVREYNALCDAEDAAEATKRERSIKFEALERLMNGWLETQNTDIFRGDGVTVSPRYDIYPSIKDPAALRAWIEETGQADKLKLPWQTLKADCAEALGPDGSGEIPPGVEVYIKTGINRRTT